jgi:hypothetical protein
MAIGTQARVEELRREIAEIRQESARFKESVSKSTANHLAEERRLIPLQEIQAELLEMMHNPQSESH